MAGADDQLIQLLLQNLGSSRGPEYNRPLFPSSFGDAMTNLGRGLANYGQETLNRSMGVPHVDPVQQALARAKLAEEIHQLQQKGASRQAFPDQSKIFEPQKKMEYFPTGEYDPSTDEPQYIPFENRTFTSEQKAAAINLYGTKLEDTSPEKRAAIEQNAIWKKSLRETTRENAATRRMAQEDRRVKAEEDAKNQTIRTNLMKQASLQKVYDHGMQHEYEPQQIEAAASNAIDPVTGELDLNKLYRNLPQGKSPKVQRLEREHASHIKAMEDRLTLAKQSARRLAQQHGDAEGFRRFNAAAKQWEQAFKAYSGDLSTIGRPFMMSPPDPEDYIGLTFKQGSGEPGANRPAPKTSGGPMGFIKPAKPVDAIDRLIYGLQ